LWFSIYMLLLKPHTWSSLQLNASEICLTRVSLGNRVKQFKSAKKKISIARYRCVAAANFTPLDQGKLFFCVDSRATSGDSRHTGTNDLLVTTSVTYSCCHVHCQILANCLHLTHTIFIWEFPAIEHAHGSERKTSILSHQLLIILVTLSL